MRYLTGGVDTGVGSTGNGQLNRASKHRSQLVFDLTAHGAQIGLAGPTREVGAVVGDVEPQSNEPAVPMGAAGSVRSACAETKGD